MMKDPTFIAVLIAAQVFFISSVLLVIHSLHQRKRILTLTGMLQRAESPSQDEPVTDSQQQLFHYKQRIENLEVFKRLFFELDEKMSQGHESIEEKDNKLAQLQTLAANQKKLLANLKRQFDEICQKYEIQSAEREELNEQVENLENQIEQLKDELEKERSMLEKMDALQTQNDHYQTRVESLERSERELMQQISTLEEQASFNDNPHPFGEVKIEEIETLSSDLEAKETEISHLRNECEMVARQYEELAARSLKDIEDMKRASKEEQINLQQMQTILEQSAVSLQEKEKEIKELETLCMNMRNNMDKQTEARLQRTLEERSDLQETILDIGNQVLAIGGDNSSAEELASLQETLNKNNERLSTERASYRAAVQSTTSQDDSSALQQQLQAKDDEIDKLNSEIAALEARCLKLMTPQSNA